jgi:hypothetical protein
MTSGYRSAASFRAPLRSKSPFHHNLKDENDKMLRFNIRTHGLELPNPNQNHG